MPILKPASAMKSCSRKLSHRQSVRLPWAIVVPNGLSFFARSTSTWIHWWSPDTSANLSMSSWVTSRQSLGPMVCPTSALSSSTPFTVVGVLMGGSLPVVVPGLRLQGLAKRLCPAAHDRLPMRHQHVLSAQLQQGLHARREPVSVKARHLCVNFVRRPHHKPAVRLRNGIAEHERVMAGEVERHLVAARLPDRVGGDFPGERCAGLDLLEGRAVLQALGGGGVPVDGRLGILAVAPPQLLRAAH